MNFNKHFELVGQHAFLSASKYHWINYSDEKLEDNYRKILSAQKGSELHDFARRAINLGRRQPKNNDTVNLYVNDGIGFKMATEQILFYSYNSFGTADTISFRKNFLRIHDLKTGEHPAKMSQLEIYTSLFCLEYDVDPSSIEIELRLYQSDGILCHNPDPKEIFRIMETMVRFDKKINQLKLEMED